MIKQLSEQFYRRLSSVHFKRRHVHVVHENNGLLAHRWSIETLASLVQPRHDQELQERVLGVQINTLRFVVRDREPVLVFRLFLLAAVPVASRCALVSNQTVVDFACKDLCSLGLD